MKFKKLIIFFLYGIFITCYSLYHYSHSKKSFEEIQPYSHYFKPSETVFLTESETIPLTAPATEKETIPATTKQSATKPTSPASPAETKPIPETAPLTELPEIQFPLELNHATFEELCAVPEIGEATAQKIIEFREAHNGFMNCQQLLEISGIGEHKFQIIQSYLYLESEYFPEPETEETSSTLEEPEPTEPPAETSAPEIPHLNLNTVTKEQLLLLPHCDEALADEIIHLRDEEIHIFYNILEITLAEHVTTELFLEWSDYLTVDDDGSTEIPYIPPYAENPPNQD